MIDIEFRSKIDEIKGKIDIVEIVGNRITLKVNNIAHCPFHDDRNPSFSVNPKGQFWYCFSCCIGGDVIKFLELYEKKSFYEVLTELAGQVGIILKESIPGERQQFEEKRTIEDILTEAAKHYHLQLTDAVKDYLINKRKMTEVSIEVFQIGFTDGRLREHLLKQFPLELCLKAGILKRSEDGIVKDYFFNRITFPHFVRGRVVNVTGRIFEAEPVGKGEANG